MTGGFLAGSSTAATSQLWQTTLRSVLGEHELDELLAERERLNNDIQAILDKHTDPWGIKVSNVEIKDVDLNAESMVRAIAKQAEAANAFAAPRSSMPKASSKPPRSWSRKDKCWLQIECHEAGPFRRAPRYSRRAGFDDCVPHSHRSLQYA